MKFEIKRCVLGVCVALALLPVAASASVVVSGTRVVYPASEKEVIVSLRNEGTTPTLVQSWIDKGGPQVRPGSEAVPFVITPPITRIEPKRGQSIRVTATGLSGVPKDRESAFWFNVLEIPPRSKSADGQGQNQVQVAFRSKIKLFYRPEGLPGKPAEAARALRWTLVKDPQGYALRATNSAVYHVSLGDVSITLAGKAYSNKEGGMIEPLKSYDFPLKGLTSTAGGGEITYSWINDYGSGVTQTASLGL
ncbi:fimbria/pilus periplasmic chaperone [Pseudomonas vancouverensis]|uniref:Uncharacterized protein n=1 Tax=Pseudomonas vancouverensis TaxID=95300 RepID=A0A1H2N2U8_PSEVA|nr:fimbria/pilus periplasmic chaperone [Pseudomonas vancouverensis]KAB0495806.1 fimbria/pilus periplasmic chaperone [Pseudomonas vancouverensis]TDB65608.1 hypothetical protein EIY72_08850 [Pseudomonas vancouverensis]SDU99797.1 chaperone protein EcpD [Pseudomonas vancouverensis]